MRKFLKMWLIAAVALGWIGLHAVKAADLSYPQSQYEGPAPQEYGPPPEQSYGYAPPPPVVYGFPPPAAYYEYSPPPYLVVPGPYYARGPYWRGYTPHYAYGYGHWGHGYRRW